MDKTSEEVSIKYKLSCFFTIILLLCGCVYFFSSCAKDEDESGNGNKYPIQAANDPVTVNFTIKENNFSAPPTLRGGINSPLSGESEEAYEPVKLRAYPLDQYTKVRVVAYESPGYTTEAGHADYAVGGGGVLIPDGTPSLTVPAGTYKFVAYTYNNSNPLTAHADTTAAIDALDLLWGEATETVGPGSSSVYLLLDHLFSQVKLHVSIHHSVGNIISSVQGVYVNHTFPKLVVQPPYELIVTTSSGQTPLLPSIVGPVSEWESENMQLFTNGGPPVLTIGSIEIDGIPHYGPWVISYTTSLLQGYEYTLHVYFTADGILCGDLESPEFGSWGDY